MDENLPYSDELIIDYLDGNLSLPDKNAFEADLLKNDELRERVERMKITIVAVRQTGPMDHIRSLHREMVEEIKGEKTKGEKTTASQRHSGTPRRIIRYTMAVAASVIALFVIFRTMNSGPSSAELYNEAFVDYQESTVRGNESSSDIERSYQQQEFVTVVALALQGAARTQKDSLLTGLSYLKANNVPDAIKWLQPLTRYGTHKQDAEFYLSLAFLKNKDFSKSRTLMQNIRETPGHMYQKLVSDELIRKIEKKEK